VQCPSLKGNRGNVVETMEYGTRIEFNRNNNKDVETREFFSN
jgi:hypothetical protein